MMVDGSWWIGCWPPRRGSGTKQDDLARAVGSSGRVLGRELSRETTEQLGRKTEGWIAGLRLAALSMRRLGQALGCEAMSLYNHVANKDDILDGIVERVLAEIPLPADDGDWKEEMRQRAIAARRIFLRHPWAIGLLEDRHAGSSPARPP